MIQRFGFPIAATRTQAGFSLSIMDIMESSGIAEIAIETKIISSLMKDFPQIYHSCQDSSTIIDMSFPVSPLWGSHSTPDAIKRYLSKLVIG